MGSASLLSLEKSATYVGLTAYAYSATAQAGGTIVLGRSKSGTLGTLSATGSDDSLGFISFEGVNSSSALVGGSYIQALQTGAAGASYIPGALAFFTSSGSALPAERARFTSDGSFQIGTTSGSTNPLIVYANHATNSPIFSRQDGAGPSQVWAGNGGGTIASLSNTGDLTLSRVSVSGSTNRWASFSATTTGTSYMSFLQGNSGSAVGFIGTDGGGMVAGGSGTLFGIRAESDLLFMAGATHRARITSAGALLIGLTTAVGSSANTDIGTTILPSYSWFATDNAVYIQRPSNGNGNVMSFLRGSSNVGTISVTSTNTAYNTSSDVRLKENIVDAQSASSIVDALQVRSFNFKSEPLEPVHYGFIAQELHEVVPSAVTAGDDGETITAQWGVDFSKLVPILVKEIQELRARVAALENQ
jgi:hypothetical protein